MVFEQKQTSNLQGRTEISLISKAKGNERRLKKKVGLWLRRCG